MSKTPRTDAILQTLDDPWGKPISNDIIRAITKDISSLEIELTEVTRRRDAYKKALQMSEDELMTARAEIERLKEGRNFWRNKCEMEESEAGKAMIRYVCQEQDKDSLIEQMRSALKIVKAHMHKTGDFYAIDDVNAALSAAERESK